MQQRLEALGGQGEPLVFAHANGYPVGSYRQFLAEIAREYRVTGIHHRPIWSPEEPPALLDWDCFSGDLVDTLAATQSEPVWMMGHSMGAVISLKAAARRPELFRGLVLVDPVFPTPEILALRRQMLPQQVEELPLVRKTLNRPNRFASRQEAFDFHRGKRAFADFSDEVLWDYIRSGTRQDENGEFRLAYGREWEAAAYRCSPEVWEELSTVTLPVLGLRGETSDTLTPEALSLWGVTQPQADLRTCRGGHLLPLERPVATAAVVLEFLHAQRGS